MRKRRRSIYPRPKIGLQFVAHLPAMIRVLRELGLTARRILDCLELEHCRHGGRENGKLICTYDDFERAGIQRSCIREGLDELVAAGLIKIVRPGRRAYADLRVPSMYRLTYLTTFQDSKWVEATHDWKTKYQAGIHHWYQAGIHHSGG
jgi:hypothetical protein